MRLKIRNWKYFQHYKNRNPPWIKLHFKLLSSKDWVNSSDSERVLAVACMLIASQDETNDGSFDADPEYFKRVAYLNKTPDFKPLISNGFLEMLADASKMLADASKMLADARPETETETETETEIEPPISPLKGGKESDLNFDLFYSAYPKKRGKEQAKKAWSKIRPDEVLLKTILKAIQNQKECDDWKKENGKFIPYPATWLNGRRWEDVLETEQEKPEWEKGLIN